MGRSAIPPFRVLLRSSRLELQLFVRLGKGCPSIWRAILRKAKQKKTVYAVFCCRKGANDAAEHQIAVLLEPSLSPQVAFSGCRHLI